MQHVDDRTYRTWKRDLIDAALKRRGLTGIDIADMRTSPPGSRRRARFAARRLRDRTVLGFNAARQAHIEHLHACTVLRPAIVATLPLLAEVLEELLHPGARLDVQVTDTDSGLDVWLVGGNFTGAKQREALAQLAEKLDLARLSVGDEPETLVERRPPQCHFAGIAVDLPAGAFLQATGEGETALTGVITEAMGDAGDIADLYAGLGTFSLPLARQAKIHAVEGASAQVTALTAAAHRTTGLRQVAAEARDLQRRPLAGAELDRFDAVVFDPPRAGAREQSVELARSTVPLIVAVSCNPTTFARDARTLVDGGYALSHITPVDQFLWSSHLELVGIFHR